MTYDELRVTKNQQASESRIRARNKRAEQGPQLENGGGTIVVPSPVYNAELQFRMRCYGFQFHKGAHPQWTRFTHRPYQSRTYDPAVWLRWAQQVYRQAYPGWEGAK